MLEMSGLEAEVRRVMEEVLAGLVGEVEPTPQLPAAADIALSCGVRIQGGWSGQVIVQASLGLAGLAASRMFGDDASVPLSIRDAQDALREIANIVAGNLKPLFGEANTLGLPEDLPGDVTYPQAPQLAQAVIEHGPGRLEVRVFETV
jgi:CheY-specific phosphatase CheX